MAAGTVVSLAGQATATRAGDGTSRALKPGTVIFRDDTIKTADGAQVGIRLQHNNALWTLAGGKSRRIEGSSAWRAPRQELDQEEVLAKAAAPKTASAGRHVERQAAESAESAMRSAPESAKQQEKMSDATGRKRNARKVVSKKLIEDAFKAKPAKGDVMQRVFDSGAGLDSGGGGKVVRGGKVIRGGKVVHAGKGKPRRGSGLARGTGRPGESLSFAGKTKATGMGAPGRPIAARSTVRASVMITPVAVHPASLKTLARKLGLRQKSGFGRCYERVLRKLPQLQGNLVIELHFNEQGRVINAIIVSSSTRNRDLEQCALATAKRLRIPPADGKRQIRYKLLFRTK